MRALYASACFGILVVAAACGGKVVFVEDDDGSGGSGASTTTGKATTTTTKSTSKSTTQVSTGVTSVSNGPTTVGVTTGGPPFCDFGSFDGPGCQSCIDQSLSFECAQVVQSCEMDAGCVDYDACVLNCGGNQGCCNQCANGFSDQSVLLHDQLLFCVFCQVCGPECPGAVPGFCGP